MIDDLFVDKWVILATSALMCSVMAVMATLHRTAKQDSSLRNTTIQRQISFQASKIRGTDHSPHIMIPDMGSLSAAHNPTAIPTTTGTAVSEVTHHVPHQATTAACAVLWSMDAPSTSVP